MPVWIRALKHFLTLSKDIDQKFTDIREERYDNNLRFINNRNEDIYIKNILTEEKIPIKKQSTGQSSSLQHGQALSGTF